MKSDNNTTARAVSQGLTYQDFLNNTWNRNLVIWELRYGAKYPQIKKEVRTLQEIANSYQSADLKSSHINMILVRMRKKARNGGENK